MFTTEPWTPLQTASKLTMALLAVWNVSLAEDSRSPAAWALLRGVLTARTNCETARARFDVVSRDSDTGEVMRRFFCAVDDSGNYRRMEHLEGSTEPAVYLVAGDVVHGYRRSPGEDLCIYDLRRSVGVRGDFAFDPRILGLADVMTTRKTIAECLWLESHDALETLGQETISDVRVTRVRALRNSGASCDLWIEEPLFRVHRKEVSWQGGSASINCEYNRNDLTSPFPSRVTIARQDRALAGWTVDIQVHEFKCGLEIPSDRFALSSFNLPTNTMINDYRINRIIGYWDGTEISEDPVPPGLAAAAMALPDSLDQEGPVGVTLRRWLIGINLAVLTTLAGIVLQRRKRA